MGQRAAVGNRSPRPAALPISHRYGHTRAVAGPTRRDSFKRNRRAEEGITLVELNIYTLCMAGRFYYCYIDLCNHLDYRPMTHSAFLNRQEIQEIVAQAALLARQSKPTKQRRRYRKPGFWPLIKRVFS